MRFGSSCDMDTGVCYPLIIPKQVAIPGTNLVVNIHGQPVGQLPPKTGLAATLDKVLQFAMDNPVLSIGAVLGGIYLVRR